MNTQLPSVFGGAWTLVTGASSGIGEAFARHIAKLGGHLVLTARSGGALEGLAIQLRAAHHVQVRVIALDLALPGGASQLAHEVEQLGVPITHVINNAGVGAFGLLSDIDPDKQSDMVRLNCESLLVLTRHFLPAMRERHGGGMIQVASIVGFAPLPQMATYAASKAFVLSLTEALAVELSGSGVRMLALCPGPVPSGFQRTAGITIDKLESMAVLSAEQTVAQALQAYAEGKTVLVPGVVNKMAVWTIGLIPRAWLRQITGLIMRKRQSSSPG